MSKQRNRTILAWQSVEADLRRLPLCRGGQRLDAADTRNCALAYTLYGLLLVDLDLVNDHDSRRIVKRLARLDVLTVVRSLKSCDDLLLEHFRSVNGYVELERFKHALAEIIPLKVILIEKVSDFLNGASTKLFRVLHQAFSFLSRLTLDGIPDDADIAAWVENNSRLACAEIDLGIADACRPWVTESLAGISIPSVGKHGSGTVNEWPLERKIRQSDKVNDPTGCLYHGYSASMHNAMTIAGIDDPGNHIPPDFYVNSDHELRFANSRLISVPKNALKRRVIAPETLSQQYFQQQLMVGLYRHIETKMPFIPIRNQGQNRELAREGSISGYWSTIDLSAASDSVSVQLVQRMFRDTSIFPMMEACRSRRTLIEEGGVEYSIPMSMYATMGSAVCFPLECIVFSALCEHTAKRVGRRLRFSVYGDDIVFPSRYADDLIEVLTACGFIVNRDKSFTCSGALLFRESCGGEYLRGDDVTPLRISRRLRPLENKRTQPSTFRAYIDMANACLDKGYLNMRRYLVKQLFASRPYPIFGNEDGMLHTYSVVTNYRLRHRWNTELQRRQCLGAVVVPKKQSFELPTPVTMNRLITGLYGECELWNWQRERCMTEFLGHAWDDQLYPESCSAPAQYRTRTGWVSL